MGDWAHLPQDLVQLIAKPLTSIDILRLRSVCASWRTSVPRKADHSYLTISPNDGISHASSANHLRKCTILLISPSNPQNQADDPRSWIVKIKDDDRHPKHFLNPLARNKKRRLPDDFPRVLDLMNFRIREVGQEYTLDDVCCNPTSSSSSSFSSDAGNLYMEKVVILQSDCRPDSDFVLLTIHISGKLALFKSGDKNWTIIPDMPLPYDDVIVYKGNFYGVDNLGRMVRVGLNAKLEEVAHPVFGGDKKFLVESEGELLLVDMYLSINRNIGSLDVGEDYLGIGNCMQVMYEKTVTFKVFKLDQAGQLWIEMKNLGDRLLFLGNDCTFSVSASDLGYKGNHIFFEGDYTYRSDAGVFGLESRFLGPLGCHPRYSNIFWPPPSWVTSTSQEAQNKNQQVLPLSAD